MAAAGVGSNLSVRLASGDAFDIRDFFVHEQLSGLFQVSLLARCDNPNVDFEAAVGQQARFELRGGHGGGLLSRSWEGICNELEQLGTVTEGLSTYRISIVPTLWLATQRRNYRVFQQLSEPDIALRLLAEWEIEPELKIDRVSYRKRKYRVQYGESDYAFLCRMLEDAGIAFTFESSSGASTLVLCDAPHANRPRAAAIPFRDSPSVADRDHVTAVQVGRLVRPGRYTLRDHDFRRPPSYPLSGTASAAGASAVESRLERFHYVPGAFVFGTGEGEDTPAADDKGKARALEPEAATLAQKRLEAKRGAATRIRLSTNAHDLGPGVVFRMLDHPRADLCSEPGLLVLETSLCGGRDGDWSHQCEAQSAAVAYRPPLATPKPKALGTESATVVGPAGEEIHCDEFGRVRVHFHWDRESKMDDRSSCWIHVSQPWGGAGFGGVNLPRVGQEVLVQFLGGDPDRPVVVGRVFTNLQKVPYKLPEHKTRSGWRSSSTKATGGYNELMFEDEAGEELLQIQAERDFTKLVKHDETVTVGNDRSLTVGRHLTKLVNENEREVTGVNRSVVVGNNRSTEIGEADATTVGRSFSIKVSGQGGGSGTAATMEQGTIVLSTGQGATLTLEGDTVTLSAGTIRFDPSSSISSSKAIKEG
jgi:type VI secretion system secreted protein VgrG